MGYTHHWRAQRPFTDEEWTRITGDFSDMSFKTWASLARWDGVPGTSLEITDTEIAFNGVGDESMVMLKSPEPYEFCKTDRKPYDHVVTALLLLCAHHAPDVLQIDSDGEVEDWDTGYRLYRISVQYPIDDLPRKILKQPDY